MERGDTLALRAHGHDECALCVALDAPGGPAAAFALDLDQRLQFGGDGRMVPECEAQASRGRTTGDPEVLSEIDPALALRLQAGVVVHATSSESSRSAGASMPCVVIIRSFPWSVGKQGAC